jgi:2-polyprenyl-3-methyl-5-hydroxy-6-metoxy-1,4-benzoquinol methylase
LRRLLNLLNHNRLTFLWRYFRAETPWDTNVTPPEVVEFIGRTPPGKALDLGCGTGTNAITLARHGWQVTGIDFIPRAVRTARRKAAKAGLHIDFHVADVSDLDWLSGPYDYVLDIGCLISLSAAQQTEYARGVARLLRPGGWFMLYGWLPRPWQGRIMGLSPEAVEELLQDCLEKRRRVIGQESNHPSAWYWYQRR